jgi:hypothetical protein
LITVDDIPLRIIVVVLLPVLLLSAVGGLFIDVVWATGVCAVLVGATGGRSCSLGPGVAITAGDDDNLVGATITGTATVVAPGVLRTNGNDIDDDTAAVSVVTIVAWLDVMLMTMLLLLLLLMLLLLLVVEIPALALRGVVIVVESLLLL